MHACRLSQEGWIVSWDVVLLPLRCWCAEMFALKVVKQECCLLAACPLTSRADQLDVAQEALLAGKAAFLYL